MPKNFQNTVQLHSLHMLARLCRKSFNWFQEYLNRELPNVQAGFRKGRGNREQIANIHRIIVKSRGLKKNISTSLTMLKPLSVWITTNWKILKEMGIPDHLTCLLRNLWAWQEVLDMEQWTGSTLGKEYVKAVYCYPACLTSMQNTSCEMAGWMNYKMESRLPGEISITSNMQMTPL